MKEKLEIKKQHAAERFAAKEITAADSFAQGYKSFLTACKTERECVAYFIEKAEAAGFEPFDLGGVEAANSLQFDVTKAYFPGKKVYFNNRGKSLILAVLGNEPLENGLRIAAAHIDSPRLDLKPVPFYEDKGLALAKTHYYGGIKKYQWVTIPLALHGVVVTKSGESIQIVIGEKPEDPKFCITDLLPHLGKEQYERSLGQGIKGEELNIVIGSRPLMLDGKAEGFKLNILKILNDRYGITEADFLSAELEAVPAYPACDIGLDAGLVGAYGQDDRVCAYPSVEAILAYAATIQPGSTTPTHTCICVLADKEEIGSCGNTGLESNFLYDFICDLSIAASTNPRTVLRNSKCLSADVNAGFDPTWPGVMEANNAAFMGQGLAVTKYTGSRGKNSASDASAEFVGWMRRVFDEANVQWQMAELGKVDEGGGGTVAAEVANLNIDVLDVGVPVLSMHAPFELASKTDIYQMRKAALAFFAA
ncbi:MAG: aminopeptidase [Oscillospiraceae bacterium]|nr:aminopeptidase [Oscillospiraceae bacterium]